MALTKTGPTNRKQTAYRGGHPLKRWIGLVARVPPDRLCPSGELNKTMSQRVPNRRIVPAREPRTPRLQTTFGLRYGAHGTLLQHRAEQPIWHLNECGRRRPRLEPTAHGTVVSRPPAPSKAFLPPFRLGADPQSSVSSRECDAELERPPAGRQHSIDQDLGIVQCGGRQGVLQGKPHRLRLPGSRAIDREGVSLDEV